MRYICRLFTKDVKNIQDIVSYKVNDKTVSFVADKTKNEYSLDDAEYVVIPAELFTDIMSQIYSNGAKSQLKTLTDSSKAKPQKKDKK